MKMEAQPSSSSSSIPFLLLNLIIFSSVLFRSSIADSENLFDTCPTDVTAIKKEFINGFPCKESAIVRDSDFSSAKLVGPDGDDSDDRFMSSVNIVTAAEFPGLNTLGLSISRIDLGMDAIVSPHSHPRATEMFFVKQGIVLAGFIDTKNRLFQKFLKEGEVIIFPKGLLHFCLNSGYQTATIFSFFNSQNPGVVNVNGAMFLSYSNFHFLNTLKSVFSLSSLKFDQNLTFPNYVAL